VSQAGVCFTTNLDVYYEGMRVFVTVPYHHPNSKQNYNCLGQVARVEKLGNSQKEIAIRFLSSESKSSSVEKSAPESWRENQSGYEREASTSQHGREDVAAELFYLV
jgi:hypothetical protein